MLTTINLDIDRFRDTARAVTTPLGHIMLVGFIILSITAVMMSGVVSIDELQFNQQSVGAQHAMGIYSDNAKEVYTGEAPERKMRFQVKGARLAVQDGSTMHVAVHDADTGTKITEYGPAQSSETAYQVQQDSGDARTLDAVYSQGAVFADTRSGAVMREQPPFQFHDQQTKITIVDAGGSGGATGAVVLATIKHEQNIAEIIEQDDDTTYRVTVTVDTSADRAGAWERYFQSQGLTENSIRNDVASGTVSYQFETETVAVRRSVISTDIRTP